MLLKIFLPRGPPPGSPSPPSNPPLGEDHTLHPSTGVRGSSGRPPLPVDTNCLGAGPVLGRTCLHSFFSVPLRPPSGFPQLASHHLPRRKATDDKFALSQLHAGLRPYWDMQEAMGLHTPRSQVSKNLLPSAPDGVPVRLGERAGLCRAGGRLGAGLRACSVHSAQG